MPKTDQQNWRRSVSDGVSTISHEELSGKLAYVVFEIVAPAFQTWIGNFENTMQNSFSDYDVKQIHRILTLYQ